MKAIVSNTMAGKNYEKAMDNAIERTLVTAGIMIEGDAVARVPVDSGRLKGSITYATRKKQTRPSGNAKSDDGVSTPRDEWTVHIGTNVEYAPHIEYGTKKTYTIRPVSAKVLRFKVDGKWVFTKKATIGPKRAQPFLRPAFDNNRNAIQRMGLREVDKGLKRGK